MNLELSGGLFDRLPTVLNKEISHYLGDDSNDKLACVSSFFARKIAGEFCKVYRNHRPNWEFTAKKLGMEEAFDNEQHAKKAVSDYYHKINKHLISKLNKCIKQDITRNPGFDQYQQYCIPLKHLVHEKVELVQSTESDNILPSIRQYQLIGKFLKNQRKLFHKHMWEVALDTGDFDLLNLFKDNKIPLNSRLIPYLIFISTLQVLSGKHGKLTSELEEHQEEDVEKKVDEVVEKVESFIDLQEPCYDIDLVTAIEFYNKFTKKMIAKFPYFEDQRKKLETPIDVSDVSSESRNKIETNSKKCNYEYFGQFFKLAYDYNIPIDIRWIFGIFCAAQRDNIDSDSESDVDADSDSDSIANEPPYFRLSKIFLSVLHPDLNILLFPSKTASKIKAEIHNLEKEVKQKKEIIRKYSTDRTRLKHKEEFLDVAELEMEIIVLKRQMNAINFYKKNFIACCLQAWKDHPQFSELVKSIRRAAKSSSES